MFRQRLAAMTIVTCLLLAAPASAQTVTTLVEGNDGGLVSSDPQGPLGTTVTSGIDFPGAFTVDFGRDGFGRAVQEPGGVGAVVADAIWANGLPGNYVVARSHWTDTATNAGSSPASYSFDFLIAPPELRIADFAGLEETDPQRPEVQFSAKITVNGVVLFEATAQLVGGSVSHALNETGTSLSPVFTGGGSVFGYDFSGYSDTLDLGSVAPGGSVIVEYEMIARVDTPGFEAGGRSNFGDPFNLGGAPGFSGAITPGGPVPTTERSFGQIKKQFD
jgi:hypothetical protein